MTMVPDEASDERQQKLDMPKISYAVDPQQRMAVILAGYEKSDSDRAARTISVAMTDPDPEIREMSLSAAGRRGLLHSSGLIEALSDSSPRVRRRACELGASVLRRHSSSSGLIPSKLGPDIERRSDMEPQPEPNLQAADPTAPDPHPASETKIARHDRDALIDTLVRALGDDNALVAEAAAWALGEAEAGAGPAAVEALSSQARSHPDPLCRESAVAALGAIGSQAGLAAVLDALEDKPAIRRRAAVALAAFEGPEAESALTRCLDDRDWQVRQAAEDLLAPGPTLL